MDASGLKTAWIWSQPEALKRLEEERVIKRRVQIRLSFDCFNLKCKGDRAVCSKGYHLGQAKDGSLGLLTVLRGGTSGVCKDCAMFTTEN